MTVEYGTSGRFRRQSAEGLISIGNYAFSTCGPSALYSDYYDCDNFNSIVIPDTVESIGKQAFYYCQSLGSIVIPDKVSNIGSYMFGYCYSLKNVTIPANISTISSDAFFSCTALSEVTFKWNAPTIASNSFGKVKANCYYPSNNAMWTDEMLQNYGGTLTWIAQEMEETVTYQIAYDANEGNGAPEADTKVHGTDILLSSTVPVRKGYSFLGWSESKTATTAEYQPENIYTDEKDITLYAVWKRDVYKISYDANGGNNAPESQSKVYGKNLVLSSNIPTHVGYTFTGWAESKTATSAVYSAGGNYTTEKDITLYAVWKINVYTVTYNSNGGSEAPNQQTKTYGINLKLSSVSPIRPGYTFLGWSESAAANSAVYQSAGTYTAEKDVTLYAVWKLNTYKVKYQLNGGSGSFSAQTKNHGEELELSSDKPVKDGYVFQGWTTEVNGTNVNYQAGGTYALEDDVVLYAVWEKEKIIAQKQTICVKTNITKEYKKNSKFKLGATAKTKLTYQSTNKKVAAVSKKGVVTIKGYGTAKIKITAAATEYYKKASKTVKISIVPAKMTGLKVTSSEKGVLLSTWKKNKQMSGYEVQFSTSKKFSANKTMIGTLPANSTYTRAKNLKSGKTYYARIRGYRKVKGIQVFGLWSDVKKIKIK